MSLNIPKRLTDVCSHIMLGIDTNKLGPRQLIAAQRMTKTGVCKGQSIASIIAMSLRSYEGLPTIHYHTRRRFRWYNMQKDNADFFNRLKATSVVLHMHADVNRWETERFDEAVDDMDASGVVYVQHSRIQNTMSTMVLPPCLTVVAGVVNIDAKGVLA